MRAAIHRFAHAVAAAAGPRTPFGRGGGALASHDAGGLPVPVVQAMAGRAEPGPVVLESAIAKVRRGIIAPRMRLDAKLTLPSRKAVNELWFRPTGPRAIVSLRADGGQGTIALPERA